MKLDNDCFCPQTQKWDLFLGIFVAAFFTALPIIGFIAVIRQGYV